MTISVYLPKSVIEHARREAEKLGLSLEEYIIELIIQKLDPRDRAVEYIEAAKELLEHAREELEKGDVRQAAERTWGAATLAIKAYAWWKEGRRLASHGELWEYSDRVAEDLGEWVDVCWNQANAMHTCFYEGWCRDRHVRVALEQVEKLVKEVETRIATR